MLRIKELREAAEMSRIELAYKSGLGLDTIARIERSGQASSKSLAKIAQALGKTIPELFEPAEAAS